jgi:threonine aldolase
VFNAAAALNEPVAEIAQHADSISFCLSKGLASPIGSLVCGTKDFIAEAAYWKKRFGGGLRQAGILAACGIVSIEMMSKRLSEDHERTQALSSHCESLPGLNPEPAATNILIMKTDRSAAEWMDELEKHGVRTLPMDHNRLRAVLHNDVGDAELAVAFAGFTKVAESFAG